MTRSLTVPFRGLRSTKLLVVALVAAAIGLGVHAQRQFVDERNLHAGLAFWAAAIVMFLIGLRFTGRAGADATSSDEAVAGARPLSRSAELVCLAAIIGVGAFLRFYRIGSIPPGLNHDAAWEGLYAIRITQGIDYSPVAACCGSFARETMFFYVVAFFQLFLGPTKFALEVASITIGLATLAAVHLLLRRLFDVRLALIATFLLAVSGWHLTFSRVGWRLILVPLFASLLLYFLVKAVQEKRPRDFVLAGVFLGLSLDTYEAARILPFIAAAYLMYEIARTPALLRTHSAHLALFGVSAVLAFAPLGWYMLHHWTLYTQRSNVLWIGNQIKEAGNLDPLARNVKSALLMFNFRANGDDFFVQQPLLDLPVSVFFTLGLTYSITRWRRRGYFLLLVMSVFTLAICIASTPNGNRGIVALIPAMAFAAVFLFEAWRWLADSFPRFANVFSIVLIGVLLYSAFATYDSYLGPDRRVQRGYDEEATIVGQYIDRLTNDYQVYAVAGNWAGFTLTYLTYPGNGDPFSPVYTYSKFAADLLAVPPASDKGTAFIIKVHPAGNDVRAILAKRFPAAIATVVSPNDPAKADIAYVLLIPPRGGAGADLSSYVAPRAGVRDARRRVELDQLAAALVDIRERDARLPSTNGEIVLACVYAELGPLCALKDQLGEDLFTDPRGSPLQYGYWYQSDGRSFTLYASFEALPPPDKACHPRDAIVVDKPNLYCLHK